MTETFEVGRDLMALFPSFEEYVNNDKILTKEQKSKKLATLRQFKNVVTTLGAGRWMGIAAGQEGQVLIASNASEPQTILALVALADELLRKDLGEF